MGLPLHYEDVFGLRTPNRDSFQPFITVPTLTGEFAAEHLAFQQSLARKGRLTHLRVLRRRIPLMGSIWDDEERLRTQ